MAENVFEAVKQSVSTREAAEFYGIEVKRNGMACCPFHDDKNPSMKVDQRFHCFGCGEDGDVIDFTAKLFNLSPKEAAEKLAQDFGLIYDSQAPPRRRYVWQKNEAQKFREDRQRCYRVLSDYYYLLKKWEADRSPRTPEEEPHPRFVEAIQKKPYVEYLLDLFLYESEEEQKAWIAEHTAEITHLERRLKIMAENKPTNRERLREITDGIEQGIKELFESEKYPKPHGKSYNKWLGDQAKPSHRELLRVAIDNALSQSPTDFEALLKLLQESGCEVSKRGKSYRLKLPGWEKAARMDSLGEGYGLEDLQAVLSGKKTHTPRKKTVTQAEPPKVNLLVDIQAKLQAGKGAGYARWAKVFNLKQMAQTMNYLSEHNLLEYAVLEEKAAAATAHHNELSAQIKAAEKRMAEIAVLRTHIVNYAKTREVYVAYRKAGYSKKFREEHEEEILLHQAAKNAFDEMGVKKLPKVKELQMEYAKLLEEKKKTYAEYRRSREEMRELLTAKANVDRVLKMEVEQDVEKEKDHGQR